ncbi:MAG TPA: hypothetical protein VN829_10490 [Dongiaceae bacterium]|nr:hypothetical protein [Dongiaceae bacterium]
MNAMRDVIGLLSEWRRLSGQEREAIEREDWQGVADQQGRKARLREDITQAMLFFRGGRPAALNACAAHEPIVANAVSDLLALEALNRERLRAKRRDRQEKLERLNATLRRLQKLRRAYGAESAVRWQSYS